MEINRDGDSIVRCRDNNDLIDIISNIEYEGEIKENLIEELDILIL